MEANIFIIEINFSFVIDFDFENVTVDTIGLKKSVLYAKKKIIDQSIIIRKNAMFSEIELKTAFEKNITITKSNATPERILLIIKTRISPSEPNLINQISKKKSRF